MPIQQVTVVKWTKEIFRLLGNLIKHIINVHKSDMDMTLVYNFQTRNSYLNVDTVSSEK